MSRGYFDCVMLVVHPYAGGARGKSHGSDYEIIDTYLAFVDSLNSSGERIDYSEDGVAKVNIQ